MNIPFVVATTSSALSNLRNSSESMISEVEMVPRNSGRSNDNLSRDDNYGTRFPRAAPGYPRARAAYLASHTECNDGG